MTMKLESRMWAIIFATLGVTGTLILYLKKPELFGAKGNRVATGTDGLGEPLGGTTAPRPSPGGGEDRRRLDEVMDNLRALSGEVQALAKGNRAANQATDAKVAKLDQVTAELRERLSRLTQQFEDLGRNLNAAVDTSKPELRGLLDNVNKLTAELKATTATVDCLKGKVNCGEDTPATVGSADAAPQNPPAPAVANPTTTTGRFPSLNLDLNAARWTARNTAKAGLTLDLVPAHDHWYTLELNATPKDTILFSTTTSHTINPVTGLQEQVLSTTRGVLVDRTFTVSALFAKRLAENFVVTGGLIDSTPGVGAEFRADQDAFRFGVQGYDFNRTTAKPQPRYRLTTSYQFYKGFYAMAGLQDLANAPLRTFFIGGGLRWQDGDFKKLVGLSMDGR